MVPFAHILNCELSDTEEQLLQRIAESLQALVVMRDQPDLLISTVVELNRQHVLSDSALYVEIADDWLLRVVHEDKPLGDYRSLKTFEVVGAETVVAAPYTLYVFSVKALK